MILSGQGSVSGVTLTFQTKATSIGSDSTLSAGILGSEEVVQLKPGKPVYIQCSTLVTLQNFCNLASPTKAEVGHWFTIAPSDSRYKNYFSKGSPSSLEQGFSISPQGFAPHATLMGATTLKGKKVLKLQATSTFWSSGSKMTKGMLYITDSTHPKLVALSPMSGTNALLYFHHAPASIVKVPVAIGPLPK